MLALIRKLVALLDSRSRTEVLLLVVPMAVTALLEMLSIGLIVPFIATVLGPEAGHPATAWLTSALPAIRGDHVLYWIAGLFILLFAVKNFVLLAMIHLTNRVIREKQSRCMHRLFRLYLGRPLAFHLQRNSAEMIRELTVSVGHAFEALRLLLMLVLELLLVVAACALLLIAEPAISIGTALVLGVVGVLFQRVMGPRFQYWGDRAHAFEAVLIKSINHGLGAIRDIKLRGCGDIVGADFLSNALTMSAYQSRANTAQHMPRLFIETVLVIGLVVVIIALLLQGTPPASMIATLGLFGMVGLRLMPSMNRVLGNAAELRHRASKIDVVYRDLVEGERDQEEGVPQDAAALPFEREIRLDGVTFHYDNTERPALRSVSLVIPKGAAIGFVGPSGSGKSTLIDVVLGLLRPQQGNLLVDNCAVEKGISAWRRRIGYVPQTPYLIDDSLRRNIAFGVPDAEINDDRVREVVSLCRLETVVATLPKGLETILGERGTRLSGGQRQRVAIARALYHDPDVLVFDEATSALDNETEREVSEAIDALSGRKTLLIIAHRLSTVRNCQRLIYLREGVLEAEGTFDELVHSNTDFQRLAMAGDSAQF